SACCGMIPMRTGTSTAFWGTTSTADSQTAARPAASRTPSAAPQQVIAGARPSVTSSTAETPDAPRCRRPATPGRGAVTAVFSGVDRGDIIGLQRDDGGAAGWTSGGERRDLIYTTPPH